MRIAKAWVALLITIVLVPLSQQLSAHGNEGHGQRSAQQVQILEVVQEDAHTDQSTDEQVTVSHEDTVPLLKGLHPATVHFPIALLIMAAFTEFFAMIRRSPDLQNAVRVMIYGGAAGAAIAALFGWIHTGIWMGGDAVMQAHRIIGSIVPIFAFLLAVLSARNGSRTLLRISLLVFVILMLVQGYLGGELAHGPNHLQL